MPKQFIFREARAGLDLSAPFSQATSWLRVSKRGICESFADLSGLIRLGPEGSAIVKFWLKMFELFKQEACSGSMEYCRAEAKDDGMDGYFYADGGGLISQRECYYPVDSSFGVI